MSEMLEVIMLVCFGCSWPLSVYKNYKSGTAAGMSKPFILLIIFGYVAGITAKILSGRINYVLIVYLFNLAAVSMNLLIYYRNRANDRRRENGLSATEAVAAR